ncbi:nitroreductase family protein [Flavobacterium beibuense]|uniref:nitroreductase family protein n=1 Tax=Flavobacterium beibuense TaxID=657326 RepID=UPI003A94BCFD
MEFLEHLNWRYATKAMNGEKIADDKINRILEAVRLAPTSSGLQPFEVLVVKGEELKNKIMPVANNQTVIRDCSHLLIFAAWDNYTEERITETFKSMYAVRGFSEKWDEYRQFLIKSYVNRPAEVNYNHAAHQAYIAFSFAIAAAATEKVDATPIEGFNPAALDELLGLDKKGFKSVLLLPLGYRDEEKDWLLTMKKARKSKDELIKELD